LENKKLIFLPTKNNNTIIQILMLATEQTVCNNMIKTIKNWPKTFIFAVILAGFTLWLFSSMVISYKTAKETIPVPVVMTGAPYINCEDRGCRALRWVRYMNNGVNKSCELDSCHYKSRSEVESCIEVRYKINSTVYIYPFGLKCFPDIDLGLGIFVMIATGLLAVGGIIILITFFCVFDGYL
jgi:hypothetical protein